MILKAHGVVFGRNLQILGKVSWLIGGGCPRTQYHMSENLQSVSSPDYSGLPNGCNNRLSGRNTSKSSRDAFNLKLESSQNGVLGRAGG